MKADVLVIEDDKEVRAAFSDLLSDDGFGVECVDNGKTAMDYLDHHTGSLPCLIFLDVMMPIMDGYAFRAEQLKDPRFARIPTIIISADGHVKKKAENMGLHKYLRKPVDIDEVLDIASHFCTRRSFKPL